MSIDSSQFAPISKDNPIMLMHAYYFGKPYQYGNGIFSRAQQKIVILVYKSKGSNIICEEQLHMYNSFERELGEEHVYKRELGLEWALSKKHKKWFVDFIDGHNLVSPKKITYLGLEELFPITAVEDELKKRKHDYIFIDQSDMP